MAAPVVNHVVTGTGTLSVTVESGEALVVFVGTHQGTISAVQFNGSALTKISAGDTAFHERVEAWYHATPDVGTYNVTFTAGGTGDGACALVISGQKTTGQPVASNSNNDNTKITQVANSNNVLFIGGSYGEAVLTMDTGIGLTEDYNMTGASYENMGVAHASNDNGAQYFRWTQASGQRNCLATIAIEGTTSTNFPILFDSATNTGDSAGVSSRTASHTVGSLTNGILVAHIGLRDATTADMVVTGVTWNTSENFTKLRSDLWNSSTYVREEIWYLKNPTAGTFNVVATATGTCDFINLVTSSWQGVDQTTPFETNAGSGTITTTATSVTTSITPTSNNNVILDNIWGKDDTITIGSGQSYLPTVVALPEHSGTDYHTASFKRQATAAATSMAWSWTASEGYAHGAGVLKPAGTSSSQTQANSVRADILATTSNGVSTRADIKSTSSQNESAKASIVVTNTNGVSSLASIKATQTKANYSSGNISTIGQSPSYSRANIKVSGISSGNSVRASIVVTNTSATSSRANIKNTYTNNSFSLADIKNTYSNSISARADIKSTLSNNSSVRANFIVTNLSGQSSKSSLVRTESGAQSSRASIVNTASKANSVTASISGSGQAPNMVRANIKRINETQTSSVKSSIVVTNTNSNSSRSSILVTNTNSLSSRSNITVRSTVNNSSRSNIVVTNSNNINSRANIFRAGEKQAVSVKSSIVVTNTNPQNSKASVVVTNSNGSSARAAIVTTLSKGVSATASIQTFGQSPNMARANIIRRNETLATSSKANIVVRNTNNNSAKSSILVTNSNNQSSKASVVVLSTDSLSAKSNIVVTSSLTGSSKASIFTTLITPQSAKASIFRVENNNNSSRANLIVFGNFSNSVTANLYVPYVTYDFGMSAKANIRLLDHNSAIANITRGGSEIYIPGGLPFRKRTGIYHDFL